MPVNKPYAEDLIADVKEMLETQFLPRIESSDLKYQARVAANVLGLVIREMNKGPECAEQEAQALSELLSEEGDSRYLAKRLIDKIHAGEFDDKPLPLIACLRENILRRIAIDNPKYPTFVAYQETGKLKV